MKAKKLSVSFLLIFFLAVVTNNVNAIGPLDIYVQGGVITDDSISFNPFLWTAGINIDIKTGGSLVLSPELNLVISELNFDYILLEPSVIANFKFANLFIGAGLTKFFELGDPFEFNQFAFKANAGIKIPGMKLRAYIITPFDDFFSSFMVGASVGFGF